MEIHFSKYQATGNDFIIIDNRNNVYTALSQIQIKKLCDRKFGVGADGLMLLNEKAGFDFEMIYFNADGNKGSLCGNGSRCIVRFYYSIGFHKDTYEFLASDGMHTAEINSDGSISLKMNDVNHVDSYHNDFLVNTGSPHYIKLVTNLEKLDVNKVGREIRYSKEFEKEGVNVNFVEQLFNPEKIAVRTYERGVENETLSCGTGVTAAALICYHNEIGFNEVQVKTSGGNLKVEFERVEKGIYKNIWLCGNAEKVFDGIIIL